MYHTGAFFFVITFLFDDPGQLQKDANAVFMPVIKSNSNLHYYIVLIDCLYRMSLAVDLHESCHCIH